MCHSINRRFRLSFALALLFLMTAHRLPAPIVDETPAPKPKIKSTSENRSQEAKKKENKPAIAAFIGTWRGNVAASMTSDVGLNVSGNAARTVIISSDGTVIYFGQSGSQTGPQHQSKVVLSRDGRRASWTSQQIQQGGGVSNETVSLQLMGPSSALYQEDTIIRSSEGNGRMQGSGTLVKQ